MNTIIWSQKANQLNQITSQIKKLELERKQLQGELKIMQEGKSFTYGRFTFELITTKGPVDYKSIPELQDVDLESYRKEQTERWLFRALY